VVELVFDDELRALEVARCHSHIVLLTVDEKVSKTPVDNSQLSFLVVHNYVQGLDISVHDSVHVREVKGFENFVDVNSIFNV